MTITFVTAKFAAAKRLPASLEGTVLSIVLHHDKSTDTPESLNITQNADFAREEKGGVVVYRNAKEGLAYTFIGGRLKTTYYTASAEQLARAQKGN